MFCIASRFRFKRTRNPQYRQTFTFTHWHLGGHKNYTGGSIRVGCRRTHACIRVIFSGGNCGIELPKPLQDFPSAYRPSVKASNFSVSTNKLEQHWDYQP